MIKRYADDHGVTGDPVDVVTDALTTEVTWAQSAALVRVARDTSHATDLLAALMTGETNVSGLY
jgi:hypothetical protein